MFVCACAKITSRMNYFLVLFYSSDITIKSSRNNYRVRSTSRGLGKLLKFSGITIARERLLAPENPERRDESDTFSASTSRFQSWVYRFVKSTRDLARVIRILVKVFRVIAR